MADLAFAKFISVVNHLECGYNSKEDVHLENINDSKTENKEKLRDFVQLDKQEDIINAEIKAKELEEIFTSKTIKESKDVRLLDDVLMNVVFNNNKEATELVLKIILGMDDLIVEEVKTHEEANSPAVDGKSIVFDILARDSNDNLYDIEMQRANSQLTHERVRFYSNMLGVMQFKKGMDFKELYKTYVIVITEHDYFKRGMPIYVIEQRVKGTDINFDDGSYKIYVNASYENDENPVGKLLHDLRCTDASKMYYEILADSVSHFKEIRSESNMGETWEERMNRLARELVEANKDVFIKAGHTEGHAEAKRADAIKMIQLGKLTYDDISAVTGFSIEEIEELARTEIA